MEVCIAIGSKVLNGIRIVLLLHCIEYRTRIIVLIEIALLGCCSSCYLTDITETRSAVRLQEVDVVRVDAAINNTCYNALTSISLRKVYSLMYFINTYRLTNNVHLLINRTRQLQSAYALQLCNAFNVGSRHHDDGNIATHSEHLGTLCVKLVKGILSLKLHHCHNILLNFSRTLKRTCAAIVCRNRCIPYLQ